MNDKKAFVTDKEKQEYYKKIRSAVREAANFEEFSEVYRRFCTHEMLTTEGSSVVYDHEVMKEKFKTALRASSPFPIDQLREVKELGGIDLKIDKYSVFEGVREKQYKENSVMLAKIKNIKNMDLNAVLEAYTEVLEKSINNETKPNDNILRAIEARVATIRENSAALVNRYQNLPYQLTGEDKMRFEHASHCLDKISCLTLKTAFSDSKGVRMQQLQEAIRYCQFAEEYFMMTGSDHRGKMKRLDEIIKKMQRDMGDKVSQSEFYRDMCKKYDEAEKALEERGRQAQYEKEARETKERAAEEQELAAKRKREEQNQERRDRADADRKYAIEHGDMDRV